MEATIGNATLLMAVGMISVLTVLLIVVLGGRGLIGIVNRLAKDEEPTIKLTTAATTHSISGPTMAVITAAVHQITKGRGHVDSIEQQ